MSILHKAYLFFIDTIQTLLFAASIFLVIYIFLFRPFQVSGDSMYPTFHNSEYILTNLIVLRFGELKHGDVIVFKAPTDPDKDFIKRVMALPGDKIAVKDGGVYVNDKKVDESKYLDTSVKTYGGAFLRDGETITVPENNYVVMGDNRPYSSDSREWGFLSRDKIIGKSFYVYFPMNNMRLVKNPYQE